MHICFKIKVNLLLKNKIILVFILSLLFNYLKGQNSFKIIEELYSNGYQDSAIVLLKKQINLFEKNPNEKVNLSKSYNLLGELYLKQNEFEEAWALWNKSRLLIEREYGKESHYLAEVFSDYSRYFSFLIKPDSSYYYAKKSIGIYNRVKSKEISVHKLYRQYAFASKIYYEKEDKFKSRKTARILLDSALYYNKTLNLDNESFKAQILADIGNTYTDEVLYYYLLGDQSNSDKCLIKSNEYYDLALTINTKIYGLKSYPVALNYFLKSLAYEYNHQAKLKPKVIQFISKALGLITINYNNDAQNAFPLASCNIINPVFALQLFRFKIDAYNSNYESTKDTSNIGNAYRHAIESIKLWNKIFSSLKSNDIHLALETYGNSPFIGAIQSGLQYIKLTKSNEIESNIMQWMDIVKYESILKYQLNNGKFNIDNTIFSIKKVQKKLKENEAIIEYYKFKNEISAFIVTKNNYRLYTNEARLNDNNIDSLNLYLINHNPSKYCSASKSIYDSIIKPLLKDLPKNISHLIIIPHGKLALIPFNALVINNTSNYKNSDFLINHYNISHSLSLRLWVNDNENKLGRQLSYLAPTYKNLSSLPFNSKLIEVLKGKLKTSEYSINDTTLKNGIFHFSGHANYAINNSRKSSLILNDSTWSMDGISKMKMNYGLAVISACETAKGEQEIGEGSINFSRNLYLAGVKSTITTLWKVDDQATSKILTDFYNELMSGKSSSESLHLAQINYLNTAESIDDYDPYYWAGLIYNGSELKLAESETNNVIFGFIMFAFFLGTVLILLRKFFF